MSSKKIIDKIVNPNDNVVVYMINCGTVLQLEELKKLGEAIEEILGDDRQRQLDWVEKMSRRAKKENRNIYDLIDEERLRIEKDYE